MGGDPELTLVSLQGGVIAAMPNTEEIIKVAANGIVPNLKMCLPGMLQIVLFGTFYPT